jgi:hypothetical protein
MLAVPSQIFCIERSCSVNAIQLSIAGVIVPAPPNRSSGTHGSVQSAIGPSACWTCAALTLPVKVWRALVLP